MQRRSSLIADLLGWVTRLHWWAGVVLALLSFLGLRALAGISVPESQGLAEAGQLVVRQTLKSAAEYAQVLIPALFLLASSLALIKHRQRWRIHEQVLAGNTDIADLTWREFEKLIGAFFEYRGIAVKETGAGADGGVDLELRKAGERYLAQCKHWRSRTVGVEPVRELYGVLAAKRASGAFVVTSGRFSEPAREFASGREIELIDGDALSGFLAGLDQTSLFGRAPSAQPASTAMSQFAVSEPSGVAVAPQCPRCGCQMISRVARSGGRAGQQFWGCRRFPQCRGTREMG